MHRGPKVLVQSFLRLGYTYGNYIFKHKDKAGKLITDYGKYTSIWKKQRDGSWKVVLDMGNSSPAPKTQE